LSCVLLRGSGFGVWVVHCTQEFPEGRPIETRNPKHQAPNPQLLGPRQGGPTRTLKPNPKLFKPEARNLKSATLDPWALVTNPQPSTLKPSTLNPQTSTPPPTPPNPHQSLHKPYTNATTGEHGPRAARDRLVQALLPSTLNPQSSSPMKPPPP